LCGTSLIANNYNAGWKAYFNATNVENIDVTAQSDDYTYFFDSAGDDTFTASGDSATMTTSTGAENSASGGGHVRFISQNGGNDTLNEGAVDYIFSKYGL